MEVNHKNFFFFYSSYNTLFCFNIRIFQNPGDIVFVLAGCAHQVCNYTCCVKTAVDFVSPEGVARSYIVNQQFRKLRHGHKRKTDILQLPNILYHAWITSWDESSD